MLDLSLPTRLALKALGNCLLMYGLHSMLPQYVNVFGGAAGFVIIGSLLTLLNLLLRPILTLITLPARLIATLLTVVVLNAVFLSVVHSIVLLMDPGIVALAITGGVKGWLMVSMILGLSNWTLKSVLG